MRCLQIEINSKDRPLFWILWWDGETDRSLDVEFCSHFWKELSHGSPVRCTEKNTRHYQSKNPLAAETALESTYMDDSLDTVEGDEKGIELCHCWVEVNPVHLESSRSTVKGCSLLLWQQGRFMVDPRTRERFWPLCWICKIQMYTDPAQWQHVPTEQNLADLGSRGTGPVEFAESPLWWNGLEWLSKSKRECPKLQLVDHPLTIMPEMKTGKKQATEFTTYESL